MISLLDEMITPELLEKVLSQAQASACHSWEHGTVFEALLEYRNPSASIFNEPFTEEKVPILNEYHVSALK